VPIASDILGLVGNTPLVHLSRIGKGLKPRLVAKLEMLNPGRLGEGPHRARDDRGGREARP